MSATKHQNAPPDRHGAAVAARQARLEIADFIERCGRADSRHLAGIRANIVAAIRGFRTSLETEPSSPVGQDPTPRN